MQPHEEDLFVIREILQGKQNSYAILVDKYKRYVFSLVLRYVAERAIAEELCQDVFIKAYRCLADYKGTAKFGTWLYTITNTTCLTHLRKNNITTVYADNEKLQALTLPYTENTTEQLLTVKARQQTLNDAIALLPPEDARIITLFYLAEQSVEEIGVILGISTGNVKIKLFRARGKLRELVETKFKNELL